MPINEVAQQLGTCATALKKICRRNKIMKWPFRQIRSITKSIQSLEYATLNESLTDASKAQYKQQITTLKNAIDDIVRDPNLEVTLVNIGFNHDTVESNCNQSDSNDDAIDGLVLTDDGNEAGMPNMYDDFAKNESDSVNRAKMSSIDHNSSADSTIDNGRYLMPSYNNGLNISHSNSTDSLHMGQLFEKGKATTASKKKVSRRDKQLDYYQLMTTPEVFSIGGKRPSKSNITNKAPKNGAAYVLANNAIAKARKSKAPITTSNTGGDHDGDASFFDYSDLVDLEGSTNDTNQSSTNSNQRRRLEIFPVNIGKTTVNTDPFAESFKSQFTGPVQLAMLQRKKTLARSDGKIVPLMEPDIGSNFKVDFAPRFILNILDSSFRTSNHQQFGMENNIQISNDNNFGGNDKLFQDLNRMYVNNSCSNSGDHNGDRDMECNGLTLSPGEGQDQMIYDDMALEVQQALLHPPITSHQDSNSIDDHGADIAANSSV